MTFSVDEEVELERMNAAVTLCNADLLDAVQCYHRLFDQSVSKVFGRVPITISDEDEIVIGTCGLVLYRNLELQFFPLVYRQLERLVSPRFIALMENRYLLKRGGNRGSNIRLIYWVGSF